MSASQSTGLLICQVCQRGVSPDALTCPGCAAPLREKRLSSTGVMLMLGTLLASSLACILSPPGALVCGGAFAIGIAILGAIGPLSETAPRSGALRLGQATDAERLGMPLTTFATALPRGTNRYLGLAIIALILTGSCFLLFPRPSDPPAVVDSPTTSDASTESSSDEPSETAPAPARVPVPAAPGSSWYCACVVEQAEEGEVVVTACRRDEAACHRLADRAREAGGTMLRLEVDCMAVEGDDTEPTSLGAAGGWVASARAGGMQLVGECVLPPAEIPPTEEPRTDADLAPLVVVCDVENAFEENGAAARLRYPEGMRVRVSGTVHHVTDRAVRVEGCLRTPLYYSDAARPIVAEFRRGESFDGTCDVSRYLAGLWFERCTFRPHATD